MARIDMTALMKDLAATKAVKVTGSYADGSHDHESDVDFYVRDDKPETPRENENIRKVIKVLEKHGVKWGSSFPGSVHTHNISGNGYLPVNMDFSIIFGKRPNKLKEVELFGVKFKTH